MNGWAPTTLALAMATLVVGGVIADTVGRVAAVVGASMTIGMGVGAMLALPPSRRARVAAYAKDGAAWGAAMGLVVALVDLVLG